MLVAAWQWQGFFRRSAIPVHMMAAERTWDGIVLNASRIVIAMLRVAAVPLVVLSSSTTTTTVLSAAGCAVALLGVLWLRTRPLRTAAAPLLEDAVWLLGTACVGIAVHGGHTSAMALGMAGGAAVLVAVIAVQAVSWGSGSSFWISARPDFQVFAPNPDNRYAMGRIHIGPESVIATVPDNGSPYPAIGVYDLRFRRVRLARWRHVRELFDKHGAIRVHVGLEEDLTAGHLSFAVPPGRYFLTVRNYLCERPEAVEVPVHVR